MSNRVYAYIERKDGDSLENMAKALKEKFPSYDIAYNGDTNSIDIYSPLAPVFISDSANDYSSWEILVWESSGFMYDTDDLESIQTKKHLESICRTLGAKEYWFTCELMMQGQFFDDMLDGVKGFADFKDFSLEYEVALKNNEADFDHPLTHVLIPDEI